MFKVIWKKRAIKSLKKIDKPIQKEIKKTIQRLSVDPYSSSDPLKGRLKGAWKFRISDYRIIYEVQHKQLIIMVVAVGHRKDIYDILER